MLMEIVMRLNFLKGLPFVLVLLAAACSPAFPTIQPEDASGNRVESQPVLSPDTPEPTEMPVSAPVLESPTDTVSPSEVPTDTAEPAAATDAPVAEACPYRPDLHATNPATVNLAAGKVQLVEFFAFW